MDSIVIKKQIQEIVQDKINPTLNLFPNAAQKIEVTDKTDDNWMYSCLWPDIDNVRPGYRAKGYILNINYEEDRDEESASFRFRYRRIKPAFIIDWMGIHPHLRENGLGSKLLVCLESVAKELGCEKRVFLHNVLPKRESFWREKGYKPTKFPDYWKIARRNL